mmetsp:Transcript_8760/g.16707  ORF Transcript_8760/g.16707 Transcript_8760/m.16707 type:complete len:88 (-) Transcript_8760:22-285(-)
MLLLREKTGVEGPKAWANKGADTRRRTRRRGYIMMVYAVSGVDGISNKIYDVLRVPLFRVAVRKKRARKGKRALENNQQLLPHRGTI